jgi:hypothetical protein
MMRLARTILFILFAAAMLYGLQQTRPLYSRITSPIIASGRMHERVVASTFALSIDTVRVARDLAVETFGKTKRFTTSGVWVVAEGDAEANFETLGLTSGEWLSRSGIRYALTDRLPPTIETMPGKAFQPGLPRRILLVFEVPEDSVAGGTIAVTPTRLYPLNDEVRIATDASERNMEAAIVIRRNDKADNGGQKWTVLPQR